MHLLCLGFQLCAVTLEAILYALSITNLTQNDMEFLMTFFFL